MVACGKCLLFTAALLPLLLLSPMVFFHCVILVDFFTPWKAFDSPFVQMYHEFILKDRPEQEETPAFELPLEKLTRDSLYEASNGYTTPVVIRGVLKDLPAIKLWNNLSWWIENYGDEQVLCKYVTQIEDTNRPPTCTIREAMSSVGTSSHTYISGESRLFQKKPELAAMVQSDLIDSVAPGYSVFTQLFMGYSDMGSDVHSATGCNFFRQIVGRKKWWLLPISETPYVYPSLNPNGFSAHSKTKIGKGFEEPSSYLRKLKRYTVTLNPGDVLLNPPWFWHGIKNLGETSDTEDLVIGIPTRYRVPYSIPAFQNNFLLNTIALASISYTYGLESFMSSPDKFQSGIERARLNRAGPVLSERQEELERALG